MLEIATDLCAARLRIANVFVKEYRVAQDDVRQDHPFLIGNELTIANVKKYRIARAVLATSHPSIRPSEPYRCAAFSQAVAKIRRNPPSDLSLGFHTTYRFFRLPSGQSTCRTV
jgi:hypothetical protein